MVIFQEIVFQPQICSCDQKLPGLPGMGGENEGGL